GTCVPRRRATSPATSATACTARALRPPSSPASARATACSPPPDSDLPTRMPPPASPACSQARPRTRPQSTTRPPPSARASAALLAPGDGADDGGREGAALEVGVDGFLREEEGVLHVVAAAGQPLPVRQRAQLHQRREQKFARGLEQDLPAFDVDADVDQA